MEPTTSEDVPWMRSQNDERYLAELDALPDGDPTVELMNTIENLKSEMVAIADELDQMGDVFNDRWPIELAKRVRGLSQ